MSKQQPKDTSKSANNSSKSSPKKIAEKPQRSKSKRQHSPFKIPTFPFPIIPLEDTIKVAQAINSSTYTQASLNYLAKYLGTSPNSTLLRYELGSAKLYGIVNINEEKNTIGLTELGIDIVAPTSPEQRQKALLKAFTSVELFKKVAEHYGGKSLPEFEFFRNSLVRDHNIPQTWIDEFVAVFTRNLEYLKAFVPNAANQNIVPFLAHTSSSSDGGTLPSSSGIESEGVREFLDTCFILMPFGEWYDKYYKEIYVPSTKDAGFEPLRADGLFNVGAVMEQIWTQIRKAKVLLADLTGKNPNVFYELGLAHALRKPVVFVAGNIEDVPFDVRHLRVVIYDIREPNWAEKLRAEITAYLKNTRTEPDKSIPQPYRDYTYENSSDESGERLLSKRRKPHD